MTKELKKLLNHVEVEFSYLNKNQLLILKSDIKIAYHQGKIDCMNELQGEQENERLRKN